MQNSKPNRTRITVERISVTSIRTRDRSQKVYCDNCKAELVPGDLAPPRQLTGAQCKTIVADHNAVAKK
ncbi:MAG: hypothetical protein JSS77_01630 [Acidobacteria bacterium]|nr:hypothetical protein [Acidobacteriota bacterium]